MKIYLKRDKSDENSRYIVYSESGEILYKIFGSYKSHVEKIYVMQDSKCIAKMRETHLGNFRTCYVTTAEDNFYIAMKCSREKVAVTFRGAGFHIRGNVFEKSYDIMNIDNSVVGVVSRQFSTSADALMINIYEVKYELCCIACAVFFDTACVMDTSALQAT